MRDGHGQLGQIPHIGCLPPRNAQVVRAGCRMTSERVSEVPGRSNAGKHPATGLVQTDRRKDVADPQSSSVHSSHRAGDAITSRSARPRFPVVQRQRLAACPYRSQRMQVRVTDTHQRLQKAPAGDVVHNGGLHDDTLPVLTPRGQVLSTFMSHRACPTEQCA